MKGKYYENGTQGSSVWECQLGSSFKEWTLVVKSITLGSKPSSCFKFEDILE